MLHGLSGFFKDHQPRLPALARKAFEAATDDDLNPLAGFTLDVFLALRCCQQIRTGGIDAGFVTIEFRSGAALFPGDLLHAQTREKIKTATRTFRDRFAPELGRGFAGTLRLRLDGSGVDVECFWSNGIRFCVTDGRHYPAMNNGSIIRHGRRWRVMAGELSKL